MQIRPAIVLGLIALFAIGWLIVNNREFLNNSLFYIIGIMAFLWFITIGRKYLR